MAVTSAGLSSSRKFSVSLERNIGIDTFEFSYNTYPTFSLPSVMYAVENMTLIFSSLLKHLAENTNGSAEAEAHAARVVNIEIALAILVSQPCTRCQQIPSLMKVR